MPTTNAGRRSLPVGWPACCRQAESQEKAERILKKVGEVEYFCREDAETAVTKLRGEKSLYHSCECNVMEKVTYAWGRPPKNGERKVSKVRYILEGHVIERSDEVEQAREACLPPGRQRDASCF